MTERASELLSELADRLSADSRDSGKVVVGSVGELEPEVLRIQKDGASIDVLVRTSVGFLEILFRSLRAASLVPWQQYYTLAREASRRYAEKGIPLESVMEGLAVFRRSVIARVMEEMAGNEYADEVLLLAQSRLGDVVEHLNSSFIRGYLDYTEARHRDCPEPSSPATSSSSPPSPTRSRWRWIARASTRRRRGPTTSRASPTGPSSSERSTGRLRHRSATSGGWR